MSARYYAALLGWRERVETFRRAIEAEVRAEDRVLDLGTGLGTFAFFAARAGAARVWGVDGDPIVHAARALAVENRLEDEAEIIRGRVPDRELPEGVDLLIFEAFPRRLLDEGTWRLLGDVARSALAPGARMLPRAARLCLAPIGASGIRRELFPPEDGSGRWRDHGIEWNVLRRYLANEPYYAMLRGETLAAEPVTGPRLPLLPLPTAEDLTIEGRWTLPDGGSVGALAFWFDLEVERGRWLSNGPETGPSAWGQVLLPVDPPLGVERRGALTARVERDPFTDGAPGWISWSVESGGEVVRGHEFAAYPAALEDLYSE